MQSYEDLKAWQLAMDLTEEIYRLTSSFPKSEQYGITSQLRRASTSVASNLAEGFGRYTYKDKAAKYTIARGECTEVECFLHVSVRLEYISQEQFDNTIEQAKEVGRTISGLIKSTKAMQE